MVKLIHMFLIDYYYETASHMSYMLSIIRFNICEIVLEIIIYFIRKAAVGVFYTRGWRVVRTWENMVGALGRVPELVDIFNGRPTVGQMSSKQSC